MADEIKQTGRISRVLPLKPADDAEHKQRRQPSKPAKAKQPRKRPDDGSHHVDEYA
jgi:hypothetical protein